MNDVDPSLPAEPERPQMSTADFARAGAAPPAAEETRSFAQAGEDVVQPLLPVEAATQLRSRWDGIQAGFVDEPRRSVEQADGLVAEAMKRLAETFADERSRLEQQWGRGDDVSTEDLRIALQRYRSFFSRLLSV